MSWQDREYAQSPFDSVRVRRSAGPARLIGGSIVTTLIVINTAIFVIGALIPPVGKFLQGHQTYAPTHTAIHHGWMELWAAAVFHGQVWRLFTAMYLHAGFEHLLMNMLTLHFLGRSLEQMWSPRKFFAVYTLAGLAGNLFFTLLAWKGVISIHVPAVGASGAIYGIIGVVAVLFPSATIYIYFLFPIKMRTAALVLGAMAFFAVVQRTHNYGGEACHLAGMVFGVWWAWRGDHWWRSTEWRLPRFRKKLRVAPGYQATTRPATEPREIRRVDEAELDRVLGKVREGGIHSLSESEKEILRAATEEQQKAARTRRG